MTKKHRSSNFSFLFLALIILLCMNLLTRMDQKPTPDYSEIRQMFEQEKVESFEFTDRTTLILNLRKRGKRRWPMRFTVLSCFTKI